MGGKGFSIGWNYTMLTIVYLKNEILLSPSSNGGKAIGSLQLGRTRADHSTMFDAKPNIPMGNV